MAPRVSNRIFSCPLSASLQLLVRPLASCVWKHVADEPEAMTWDKDAIYEQAKAVATEFYGRGYQIVNGPTSEPLGRTPWGGRLGEAFGPDAYQNGIAFGLSVKAYTEVGVIAGGKHFLLNEQETNRAESTSSSIGTGSMGGNSTSASNSTESGASAGYAPSGASDSTSIESRSSSSDDDDVAPYSSNADDKTIHEAYLWPFYDAVKNGMGAVMCAMTEVNGSASCENGDLLMGLLKTE